MTQPSKPPVVAIDGPSGSGKGTVGLLLASRLGWHFLDSGALYRIVGLVARRSGVDLADAGALARIAGALDVEFRPKSDSTVMILVGEEDVSDALRAEESADAASRVAAVSAVRQALLRKQHAFRRPPGLVADGRDMGTTVFPDAIVKVFLTADADVRARRRHKQLKEKGSDVNLPRLLDEIHSRDARDSARAVSPLKPAADAHLLDTSDLSISEVVDRIESLLHRRTGEGRPG
jgi:cytidylate kinase